MNHAKEGKCGENFNNLPCALTKLPGKNEVLRCCNHVLGN